MIDGVLEIVMRFVMRLSNSYEKYNFNGESRKSGLFFPYFLLSLFE